MNPNKKNDEYKRIIKRFLKSAGLYSAFIRYMNSNGFKKNRESCFNVDTIDDVFGQVNFTESLDKQGLRLKFYITHIFRTYMCLKYKNKYPLKESFYCDSLDDDICRNINTDISIIDIKNLCVKNESLFR